MRIYIMYTKPFNIEMESHEKSMKILNINLKFRSLNSNVQVRLKRVKQSSRKQNKVNAQQSVRIFILAALLFVFRLSFPTNFCRMHCVHSLFSKKRKSKSERKREKKNTRKQHIYKENSTEKLMKTNFKLFLLHFAPLSGRKCVL